MESASIIFHPNFHQFLFSIFGSFFLVKIYKPSILQHLAAAFTLTFSARAVLLVTWLEFREARLARLARPAKPSLARWSHRCLDAFFS
jgi:hypothetical protein